MTNCPPAELRFRSELRDGNGTCYAFGRGWRASCQVLDRRGLTALGRAAEPCGRVASGCLSNRWTLGQLAGLRGLRRKNPGTRSYPVKALRNTVRIFRIVETIIVISI